MGQLVAATGGAGNAEGAGVKGLKGRDAEGFINAERQLEIGSGAQIAKAGR